MSKKKTPKRAQAVQKQPRKPLLIKQEPPKDKAANPGQSEENNGNEIAKVEIVKGHQWERVIAIAAVAAIIIAGTLSVWQICEHISSTHKELRAYVSVIDPWVDTLLVQVQKRIVEKRFGIVYFVNYGKTPAFDIGMSVRFQKWNQDKPAEDLRWESSSPDKKSVSTLAPGESEKIFIERDTCHWDEHGWYQIYGKVFYFDHERKPHYTVFGYQWHFGGDRFARLPGLNYTDE